MVKKVDKVACPSKDDEQKKWFVTNGSVFLKVKCYIEKCQDDDKDVNNWNRDADKVKAK